MEFPGDVPRLTDGAVTLRAHAGADLAGVVEQCTDPESIRWTTVPVPYTAEDGRRWLTETVPAGWRDGTELGFAIEAPDEHGVRRFAGSASLRPEGGGVAEVGYGLAAWARGRHVMSRALRLLLDWGFEQRGLAVVVWRANVGNWASRRVAWAAGFTLDGTVGRLLEQRDERYDAWIGSLRHDDSREPKSRWLDTPVLDAGDVVLRPWRDSDVDRIVAGCSDPDVQRWLAHLPHPYIRESAARFLLSTGEQAAAGSALTWCVADEHADRALGAISVFDLDGRDPGSAETGYWTHPDARGRGVTLRALRRVLAHGFAPESAGGLGLRRLDLTTAAGNTASRRVAEAAGFRPAGVDRLAYRLRDGYDDRVRYDLLADEVG
ncbi:MAG: GNAT family N-acetyltransferase [Actinomycetota bacterium]|nr:GNAT family N-acetyltransferase [Actinomycetota bacterium]